MKCLLQLEEFQFLIGRLKTPYGTTYLAKRKRFQFLIGRLKTGGKRNALATSSEVSIPHRQAKNKFVLKA